MISNILNEKIETLPVILSIQETADFFSIPCKGVYRLIRAGKIPAYKDDEGKWCINRIDLKAYCSRNSNL